MVFRQDTCVLFGRDGAKQSNYWIHLAGWSQGIEENKAAPVSMKTLYVLEKTGKPKAASQWNTSKVDGVKGAISYTIPIGGFVELYILWPVAESFQPKRVVLTDLAELDL